MECITDQSRPALARGARLSNDKQTGEPMLLFPEGVVHLSTTAHAILQQCDGQATVSSILSALTGEFDFALRWSPMLGGDQSPQAPLSVPPQAPDWLRDALLSAPPSDGVSLFSALREQLGLKLEPRDEPLDVLVIDQIEHPSPN